MAAPASPTASQPGSLRCNTGRAPRTLSPASPRPIRIRRRSCCCRSASRAASTALKKGRRGPVRVEMRADVRTAELAGNEVDYTAIRATRSAGDARDIDDAAKMLVAAKNPIVIAGQGVLYAEASPELL